MFRKSRSIFLIQTYRYTLDWYKIINWNIIMLFVSYVFLIPVRRYAVKVGYPVDYCVLPHLISNLYFQISLMGSVIYFFSDIPFVNRKEFYVLYRCGRVRWALSHMNLIIMRSFLLMLNLLVITFIPLVGQGVFCKEWGKVLFTLANYGAPQQLIAIDMKLLRYFSPLQATALTIIIGSLVIAVLGIFMFMISLYTSREWGIAAAMIFVVLPLVAENFLNMANNVKLWRFSPISWMRITRIEVEYNRGLPSLKYVLTCLIFLILLFSIFIINKIRYMEFDWNDESA